MDLPSSPHENSTENQILLLILGLVTVFSLGIGLRIFDLTDEPIAYYPLRQLQGAVIARGIYFELLTDVDEALRQKAMAMEHSLVEHEPRILQHIVAYTYYLVGNEIPWVATFYNTFFWMIGGLVLFALAYRMANSNQQEEVSIQKIRTANWLSAYLALTYYMTLPFSVITSRSFQPDPGMVMFIILASYSIYRFSETPKWIWAILSGLFSGLAILVKVMAFGPILGVTIAMLLYSYGPRNLRDLPSAIKALVFQPKHWLLGLLMITPAFLFYTGRAERVSSYTSGWMVSLVGLLFTPSLYLNWAKLVIELFHPLALISAGVGLWFARGRNRALLLGLWLGYVLYGLFFPYQIGTHDYYHLMLVPIVALSMIPFFKVFISRLIVASKFWKICIISTILLLIGYYSVQTIYFYAREDYRWLPDTWQVIASQIPSDGKVIAVTEDFGMRLLYYGWRNVDIWPNINQIEVRELRGKSKPFEELFTQQTKGKKYFLVTDFDEFDQQVELKKYLNEHYTILSESDSWILYNLANPSK
jgi:hypothetical protein